MDKTEALAIALKALLDEVGKSECADKVLDSRAAGQAFEALANWENRGG